MKILRSVFFYGLAGYAGWYGINYATNTKTKFPEQPYLVIANLEPSSGVEEPVCHMQDEQWKEASAEQSLPEKSTEQE